MTNTCTCKAEHWQPHADSCPQAKQNKGAAVTNPKVLWAKPSDLHAHSPDCRGSGCVDVVARLDYEVLRGNLSLAEDGLAAAMQEIERRDQQLKESVDHEVEYKREIELLAADRAQDQQQLFHLEGAVEQLRAENTALRNLAANLRPGPISEALAGAAVEPATLAANAINELGQNNEGQQASPTPEPGAAQSGVDFDKDLARLDGIRQTMADMRRYSLQGVPQGEVEFLLSFIDNLWREYSRSQTKLTHSPASFAEGYINAADHLLIKGEAEVYKRARKYRDEKKSGEGQ